MSGTIETFAKSDHGRDAVERLMLDRQRDGAVSWTMAETPTHFVLTVKPPVPARTATRLGGAGALEHLAALEAPMPVSDLDEPALRELQVALGLLGYPVGRIDGAFGPRTRNAWAEFKTDVLPGNPGLVGPEAVATLRERLRSLPSLGAPDLGSREATIAAIRDECIAQRVGLPAQVAYVLATTQWETAKTFRPVKEAFWKSEAWRRDNLRYFPFYGRGYVQLTWKTNYETYSNLLGVDLVADPDLALDPPTSLFVLVHGFKTGTFTGRKITDFIDAGRTDFVNARRCINGMDNAHAIAELAEAFLVTS